jgi:hypothetical protein
MSLVGGKPADYKSAVASLAERDRRLDDRQRRMSRGGETSRERDDDMQMRRLGPRNDSGSRALDHRPLSADEQSLLEEGRGNEIRDQIRAEVRDEVRDEVMRDVRSEVLGQVRNALQEALREQGRRWTGNDIASYGSFALSALTIAGFVYTRWPKLIPHDGLPNG